MSACRHPKFRRKLTRYRSAAHLVRGLKHENRATAASEIRRANKPVVTAADDDAVVMRSVRGRCAIHHRFPAYACCLSRCASPSGRKSCRASYRRSLTLQAVLRVNVEGATHIPKNRPGSVVTARSHDATTRMRARDAHVHTSNRRSILRISGNRPVEQQLIESQLALKNITLRQPNLPLDIPWRANFRVQDEVLEIGAVPRDGFNRSVTERLALRVVPFAIGELVRTVLYEHRHVVLTVRCHRGIDLRRDQDVQIRRAGPAPLLPVIIGPFPHLDRVSDMHITAPGPRSAR